MTPGWRLEPLLAPRSIAIIGASEAADSWAPEIERSLRHVGYAGALHPVNPKYDTVWGVPCVPSIADLPRNVDLVVFVVPARLVVGMIDDCAAQGVRSVMVVSSGFAEAGDEGRALQDRLREAALRHHLPVLGPNVEGFVNYVDHVAPYGTTPPADPVAGSISVISQSGTVAWTMNQMASDRGVGLRIILGVGNEAVLGLGDLFSWAADDPHTKVVTSYVETMRDVAGIGRGLDALRSAGKPVLICAPQGRSEAALRAIVAHTGALAGNTGLRDAWLKGHGVVLVDDPVTMFEAAVLLAHHRKLRTDGIAGAFQSGGACTLFAEAAGTAGLTLPAFAAPTKRALRRALPSFASQNNPLDVTGQAAVETDMFVGALTALASDPAIGLVAFDAFPPRLPGETPWADPVLATVMDLQRSSGVAFASVSMSPLAYTAEAKAFTRKWGALPFLQGHRAAAGAIRALVDAQRARGRATREMAPHANRTQARRILRGRTGPLDEATGARILELYGVRRPKEALVRTPAQAVEAARKIRSAVAVKAVAPELPHKAKSGRRSDRRPGRRGGRGRGGGGADRGPPSRRSRAEGARAGDDRRRRGPGRRGGRRAVRRVRDDAAGRRARGGGDGGVRRGAARPEGRARLRARRTRRPAAWTRRSTTWVRWRRRSRRSRAQRTICATASCRWRPTRSSSATAGRSRSTPSPRPEHPRDRRAARGARMGLRRLLRGRRRKADRQPLDGDHRAGVRRARGDRDRRVHRGLGASGRGAHRSARAERRLHGHGLRDPLPGAGAGAGGRRLAGRRDVRAGRRRARDRGPRRATQPPRAHRRGRDGGRRDAHVDRPPQAPRGDARDAAGASLGGRVGDRVRRRGVLPRLPVTAPRVGRRHVGVPVRTARGIRGRRVRAAEVARRAPARACGDRRGDRRGRRGPRRASSRSRSGPRPGSCRSSSSPRRCSR